jgi:hypothetical protein
VLKEKKVNYGVLKISSPEHNIEGELCVMWGLFIIGACLLGRREHGYDAVKLLLSLNSGNFEYIDFADSKPIGLDNDFKIRLTDLVSLWPNIPESLDQLNHRTSMNRMRQLSTSDQARNDEASVMIDQNVLKQLQEFDRKTMHLRAVAFWSAAVVFTSLATLMGFLQH